MSHAERSEHRRHLHGADRRFCGRGDSGLPDLSLGTRVFNIWHPALFELAVYLTLLCLLILAV
jgi:hypothetical protein